MLQPFEPFRPVYLTRLLQIKKFFLVSQSYKRGASQHAELAKTSIIVSAYDDMGLAKTHWNAVKEDPFAAIINLQKENHRNKIVQMLEPDSRYHVFWAVVKSATELERKINAGYKAHMQRYLEKNTNWRIDRNSGVRPTVQLVFGQLYLVLKYGNQTLRINFEEIEMA